MGKLIQRNGSDPVVRVHSHGGSVYENFRVGVQMEIFVVVFGAPSDHHKFSYATVTQNRTGGQRRAAASENHRLFALHVNAQPLKHTVKAEVIGVVAKKPSVGTAHHGIYRADPLCLGGYGIEKGKHGLLIGNGHVKGVEATVLYEGFHLALGKLHEIVGIVRDLLMYDSGKAVTQMLADKPAPHM